MILWIGIVIVIIFLFGGEWIASSFGWEYPEWLSVLSGFVEIIFGLLLIVSGIPLLWRKSRK